MTQKEWQKKFSEKLTTILRDRGMKQSRLAEQSGLSDSRISDYIKMRSVPTIFAVMNMAYALDVNISDLVDFDERVYN